MNTDTSKSQWQYLELRPNSWRKQLFFKGRKLRPATVWSSMLVEKMTPEEAADNWDLSIEELKEAIAYCEQIENYYSKMLKQNIAI